MTLFGDDFESESFGIVFDENQTDEDEDEDGEIELFINDQWIQSSRGLPSQRRSLCPSGTESSHSGHKR